MAAKSLKFTGMTSQNLSTQGPAVKSTAVVRSRKRAAKPALAMPTSFPLQITVPKWSSSSYDSDKWGDAQGNPARGRQQFINFSNLPKTWRAYAKLWLCASEQVVEHGQRNSSSFGTASIAFSVLSHFLGEVDKLGVAKLADISEDQVQAVYLGYAKSGVSQATLNRYLAILARSHRWGPSCLGVLADGLRFDPAKDSFMRGKARQAPGVAETPALLEDVAHKLLAMAVDWIENRTDDVVFVISAAKVAASVKAAKAAKIGPDERMRMLTVAQARNALEAHPEVADGLRALPERLGFEPRTMILEGHQALQEGAEGIVADFMKISLIAKKMQQIHQGFAYIICAGFNGWRSSEVFSVSAEGARETPAGFTLESKIIKTAANRGDPIRRPVPDIVAKAVKSLAQVNSELEGLFPRKNGRQGAGLFRSTTGCDIDVKSVMEDINYAWTFFQGSDIGLRSHQFRKFFAHFFIRRFKGGADAVRWHFRHVSKEMIWAYAKDAMNAKQLVESKKELAAEIVNGIVFGTEYASVAVGRDLKEVGSTLRLGARVLTVEEAAGYIAAQVEQRFVEVNAMEWGYCLFQNGDKGAACEAKIGPIEARAEPSTCGRCKFLCTGAESVPFWQQTALLHQGIVEHPRATKIMKSESERLLATAEAILSRHGEAQGETP